MTDCIFCKIASGEIKGDIVYKDSKVIAFNDISPQAPAHILVVPRRHVEKLMDLPSKERAELLSNVFEATQKIVALDLKNTNGYRVVLNQGPDAGQAVPHIHFHLLSGRKFAWPPG